MANVVIYYRVSSEDQVTQFGLDMQLNYCEKYCNGQGWNIIEKFCEEGESAKTADRPQLLSMIEYCRKNKDRIDYVVVHKVDRLARNVHDHMTIKAQLARYGTKLVSATEPIDESPVGKLMETMLSGIAEFDNAIRTIRSTDGMLESLKAGKWPSLIPLGYYREKVDRKDRKSKGAEIPILDKTDNRYELIKRVFEVFELGNHSVKEITVLAKRWGLRFRDGDEVSEKAMHKILRNQFYYGWLSMHGTKINFEGPGVHEAIISKETFFKVQEVLKSNNNRIGTRHRNRDEFPLKKIIKCSVCGKDLTASPSPNKQKRIFYYYHCKLQGHIRIPVSRIENVFLDLLKNIQPTPGVLNLFRRAMNELVDERLGDSTKNLTRLDKELEKLREERKGYFQMRARGEMDDQTFAEMRDEIEIKITRKEQERETFRKEEIDIDYLLSIYESLFRNVALWWKEAPLEGKQQIQKLVFPKGIIIEDKNGRVTTPEISTLFAFSNHFANSTAQSSA